MNPKTKLELTWIGKENRPKLDLPAAWQAGPRILLEDLPAPRRRQAGPEKSYHTARRVTDHDLFDNRRNFGDILRAFKAQAALHPCRHES